MNGSTVPDRGPVPFWLLVITLVGVGGHALLFAGLPLSRWLLPGALLLAWGVVRPTWSTGLDPRAWRWADWLVAAVLVVGFGAIAWGSVATPDRSWDGFATWSLSARHLLAGEGLDGAYFADPTVFQSTRGYPLLQPILLQQTSAWLGPAGGRLLFPLLWLCLLGSVGKALREVGAVPVVRQCAVLGLALVPLFTEPGHGSAESGFAELLLATLLVQAARAVLLDVAASAICVALLLPLAKHEGALHLGLWVLLAAATGRRRAAFGAMGAGAVSLLVWLPVQHQLLHPGGALLVGAPTLLPALSPLLAVALGLAWQRWRWWTALLALPAPWLVLGLGGAPGSALANATSAVAGHELNWRGLPSILAAEASTLVWLRKFGGSFLLLLWLAARAWRARDEFDAPWRRVAVLVHYTGLVGAAITAFLLTVPPDGLALFLREGVSRYLAQTIGVVWLANGLLLGSQLPLTRLRLRSAGSSPASAS